MKRLQAPVLGISVLETLLVLCLMGIILFMSIQYYQTARTNAEIQETVGIIQTITAAADNLAASSSGYQNITLDNLTTASSIIKSPWGGDILIINTLPNGYTVNIENAPIEICTGVVDALKYNTRFAEVGDCVANGIITYTYKAGL